MDEAEAEGAVTGHTRRLRPGAGTGFPPTTCISAGGAGRAGQAGGATLLGVAWAADSSVTPLSRRVLGEAPGIFGAQEWPGWGAQGKGVARTSCQHMWLGSFSQPWWLPPASQPPTRSPLHPNNTALSACPLPPRAPTPGMQSWIMCRCQAEHNGHGGGRGYRARWRQGCSC